MATPDDFKNNHKTSYLYREWESLGQKIKETKELGESDPGFLSVAEEEVSRLEKEQAELFLQMEHIMSKDIEEEGEVKEAIVEIRAGAGGEEAALFATMLAEMYQKYAAKVGWEVAITDESKTDIGGYKEVVMEFFGKGVFEALQYESGVHRIQRIPETGIRIAETRGRIPHLKIQERLPFPVVKIAAFAAIKKFRRLEVMNRVAPRAVFLFLCQKLFFAQHHATSFLLVPLKDGSQFSTSHFSMSEKSWNSRFGIWFSRQ
jgi:hypothetical protein